MSYIKVFETYFILKYFYASQAFVLVCDLKNIYLSTCVFKYINILHEYNHISY